VIQTSPFDAQGRSPHPCHCLETGASEQLSLNSAGTAKETHTPGLSKTQIPNTQAEQPGWDLGPTLFLGPRGWVG
jgi:hypothetical protein